MNASAAKSNQVLLNRKTKLLHPVLVGAADIVQKTGYARNIAHAYTAQETEEEKKFCLLTDEAETMSGTKRRAGIISDSPFHVVYVGSQ